jgi:hypothetical protein
LPKKLPICVALSVELKESRAKVNIKFKRQEASAAIKKCHYHMLMACNMGFDNLNMGLENWEKGTTKSALSFMYNCRVDPDLGIGRAAVCQILCACSSCWMQVDLPWSPGADATLQPRYTSSLKFKFWPIFEGLNDWHVVKCDQQKKDNDEDLVDLANCMVLEKEPVRTMYTIEAGKIGAMSTDNLEADGYTLSNGLRSHIKCCKTG